MFGPEIREEYETFRDRIDNGLTAIAREVQWFAKIIAGSLIVIATCAVIIATEMVLR